MIEYKKVTKFYDGDKKALNAFNIEIANGAMVFLVGHSGAGKSTFLRLLLLLEQPSEGDILLDGESILNLKGAGVPKYRRKIGTVFQDHQLLLGRNVFENVALPLYIAGLDDQEIYKRVRAALHQVALQDKFDCKPTTLSAGEQQRVGIARAIVNNPSLIIADEPTGNLDHELSLSIISLFEKFNHFGTTVVVVTHDMELIRRTEFPVIVLDNGSIKEIKNPNESLVRVFEA